MNYHTLMAAATAIKARTGHESHEAAVVLGSGLIAWPVARLLGYQWQTFVPPMMFSNAGNMGVPLIILTFGNAALPAAVLLFAIENFLHFLLGQQMITQRWSLKSVFQNPIHTAPPLILYRIRTAAL